MFTDEEITHIKQVKDLIEVFIDDMKTADWWNGNFNWNQDLYLTGGAIASLIQGLTPKDWDFYNKTKDANDDLVKWLTTVGLDEIDDVHKDYKEVVGKDGKMITANAITMKNGASFITLLYGSPDAIRSTFDYVHCVPYYDLTTKTLHISKIQYECCKNKYLIVNNPKSVKEYREKKFLMRGYKKKDFDMVSISIKAKKALDFLAN